MIYLYYRLGGRIHMRHVKIIATIGPASSSDEMLEKLIELDTNIFRLNCSHGDHETYLDLIQRIRAKAEQMKKVCPGILMDLQGPKLRIGAFKSNQGVLLKPGDIFYLDASMNMSSGTAQAVGIEYKALIDDVMVDDVLVLDDGNIELKLLSKTSTKMKTQVTVGGTLLSNKGINLKNGGLNAPTFTPKDAQDLEFAIAQDVDFIALSFVKNANDVFSVREAINESGKRIEIISKIERQDALPYLDEIIRISDGVMIARGDLALEVGFAKVPAIQKSIIKMAQHYGRFAIVATQMMESMISHNHPTRAEVSDVANAVLDHSDALMLSAETATGQHPDLVIKSMGEICLETQHHMIQDTFKKEIDYQNDMVSKVVAESGINAAKALNAKAVLVFTELGATVQFASRMWSSIPIIGLSRKAKTCQIIQMYRGVLPVHVSYDQLNVSQLNDLAVAALKYIMHLQKDDLIVIVKGDLMGVSGHTNAMEIWKVGQIFNNQHETTNLDSKVIV